MLISLSFEKDFDDLYAAFLKMPHGEELLAIDGISPAQIDVGHMSHSYFTKNVQDMSVDANANANGMRSVNNYSSEITKGILKLEGYYLIWRYSRKRYGKKRADELLQRLWSGQLYFHDASGVSVQIPYCWAFSTTPMMVQGRPYGQLWSLPPKRADSFIAQVTECTMDMSQDFAGAVAPADLIVNFCYYAKKENLDDKTILNLLQKYVHVMNNGYRTSGQSPFVNMSLFDMPNLQKVFGEMLYPDGSSPDFDYIMRVQKLFGEWFAKGEPVTGLPYRFPVVTVNVHKDKSGDVIDKDFFHWVAKVNKNLGCFNIYINDGFKVATCCRLVNDRSKLHSDSFGNGGLNIGSHRVVTINLPRVAMEAMREYETSGQQYDLQTIMLDVLSQRMQDCFDLLQVHRHEILRRRIRDGLSKFFKPLEWFEDKDLFSVVGIVGLHEMIEIAGQDILTKEGQDTSRMVLMFIEDKLEGYSEETGLPFSCEEIPAESAAGKLPKMDKLCGHEYPYSLYSNQYVPTTEKCDMMTRIEIAGMFQSLVSGGGILHINVDSQIMTEFQMEAIMLAAIKAGVQHFAINYGFGICEHGHSSIVGTGKICPVCGGEIVNYLTRVIGYFTYVSSWNKERRELDYPNRQFVGGDIS